MSLDTANVLITGGLGQVGIAIINYLTKNHPSAVIHVLDLSAPGINDPRYNPKVIYYAGDITNRVAVKDILQIAKPQVIFHTAGLIPQIAVQLGMDNEPSFMKVNLEGTRIVLEESKQLDSVKAFLYTSTADVVKGSSWQNLNGVDEETPIPKVFDAPYPKSKALAEQLVLSNSSLVFPTAATRAHAVFGPNDRNLIPLLLAAPRNIRLGPSSNLYDFTYSQNYALGNCLAAANLLDKSLPPEKSAAGKAFFVTNAEPVQFKDFLSWVYEAYDGVARPTTSASAEQNPKKKPAKVTEIPISVAKVLVWVLNKFATLTGTKTMITFNELGDGAATRWFDNSRARDILGYVPEVDLKDGVITTVKGLNNTGDIVS